MGGSGRPSGRGRSGPKSQSGQRGAAYESAAPGRFKGRRDALRRSPEGQPVTKRPRDPNALAKAIVGIATGEIEDRDADSGKDPAASELGKKGGKARAASLTPEKRKEIAQRAAKKRWS